MVMSVTNNKLLALSLSGVWGFQIPPPAATSHSAPGPPLPSLPDPHLSLAPTIPKLLSVSLLSQLTRSLSNGHIATRPVGLTTVPSGLPTCQCVPADQGKAGGGAGGWPSVSITREPGQRRDRGRAALVFTEFSDHQPNGRRPLTPEILSSPSST